MILKLYTSEDDAHHLLAFWCPGCKREHDVRIKGDDVWGFNGNHEKPTFTPSVLVNGHRPAERCHSFVTDGRIQFLDDCHHELRGQTVDLPHLPDDA